MTCITIRVRVFLLGTLIRITNTHRGKLVIRIIFSIRTLNQNCIIEVFKKFNELNEVYQKLPENVAVV